MSKPKSVIYHIIDIPNITTLINVLVGLISITSASSGNVSSALALINAAVFIDHLDGYLARLSKNRSQSRKKFGGELDTLADLLNFGAVPALICFVMLHGSFLSLVGGGAILLASVLRLAFFNIYGMDGGSFYGLTTTYAAFLFTIFVVLLTLVGLPLGYFLPILMVGLAVAEISTFRMPKFGYPIWSVLVVTSAVGLWIHFVI
ncbi:CDP-alcohol phosphatidyltransferase family protein [Agrobacterium vitis]|uniref:CDP-alcohol phosphatidyltransferase family protein n=1 Tax=Agrobacterium vitis TaxID=373 RepID=UPI0012E981D3|nr:CDP-alcohol phosphatidyltransferase family protein [Agrobacterium vitis]